MNTQLKSFPMIERSDWFNIKEAKKMMKQYKKIMSTIKSHIAKLKRQGGFQIGDLLKLEVSVLPDIESFRREYLDKKRKMSAATRRKNKSRGLTDDLDLDILQYRYNQFEIFEVYAKFCWVKPKLTTVSPSDIKGFKVYYDEILIRK